MLSSGSTPTAALDEPGDSHSQTTGDDPLQVTAAPMLEEPTPEQGDSLDVQQPEDGKAEDETPTVGSTTSHSWPAALGQYIPFTRSTISTGEQASYEKLLNARIPTRNDIELARLYQGWQGEIPEVVPVEQPLPVGTIQQLNVLNHDSINIDPITAELLAVSEHAYFWFDVSADLDRFSQRSLEQIGQEFDEIYEASVALFGSENNPGVDGDSRLHVVNAAPGALFDDAQQFVIAGYFSAADAIPEVVDPKSNAREMFVMNADYFGSDFYINVLTHEFRHMIEDNYDIADADWEIEGAAMLAEDLLGYTDNAINRANVYLEEPDQQLNSWTDGNTTPYYGQGYLLSRFIYDQLGQDFYIQFSSSQEDGLQAVTTTAASNGLDFTGTDLWLDWLVALALHDGDGTPPGYQFGVSGLRQVAMHEVDAYPVVLNETVAQFAADYYDIVGQERISLDFKGSALVPLLDAMPASGQWMWVANRGNYGHATLTREVDLTALDTASLSYEVYYDIEAGWDFAYLFISEDGGITWKGLETENMAMGEADPSDSALAERFYTGRSEEWLSEQVDLSPYTGQNIMIRFAYVTDPILTKGGIGIDNIAIPEIGLYDDVESSLEGWTAEGFERVTATIPQQWHLILITLEDGSPLVDRLTISPEEGLSQVIDLRQGVDRAILIVAASAPMTLQAAHYQLTVDELNR